MSGARRLLVVSMIFVSLGLSARAALAEKDAVARTFSIGAGASGAIWIETGDINGDGLPDIVTANEGSNNLSVLLNDGKGGFLPAIVSPSSGSQPKSVALGDFNGDGKLDAVTANFGSGSMSVFFGNGDGTFQPAVNFPVGLQTQSVCVGDLNNDGRPDIMIASVESENYNAYLSNGDGTFTGPITFTFYNGYAGMTQIKLGDMDGDDILDVVGIYGYGQGFQVWRGNGDGSFSLWSKWWTYGTIAYPNGLALAKINRDRAPDIVVGLSQDNAVGVSRNLGQGRFSPTMNSAAPSGTILLAMGDVDGDGLPDAVTTGVARGLLQVALNQGDGTFGSPVSFKTGHPNAAVVARFGHGPQKSIAYATDDAVGILRLVRTQ